MEFRFTGRGARKLIRNRYQYVKQKDLASRLTSWKCIERRKGNCKAKVKSTAIDDFVEQVQEHPHAPPATRCELTKVCASIKRKASTTHHTTQQILGTELANLTPTAAWAIIFQTWAILDTTFAVNDRNKISNQTFQGKKTCQCYLMSIKWLEQTKELCFW